MQGGRAAAAPGGYTYQPYLDDEGRIGALVVHITRRVRRLTRIRGHPGS